MIYRQKESFEIKIIKVTIKIKGIKYKNKVDKTNKKENLKSHLP